MLFLFLSFNNLHLFTRDSTSCLAALIFSSLDMRVVSRDTIASRSRCRMFAIICSAVRETSRLAVAKFLSSSEIVSSNSLMTWQSWVSFSLMILAPDMMFSFSSCAALSSKTALWFWWSVTMQIDKCKLDTASERIAWFLSRGTVVSKMVVASVVLRNPLL